MEALFQGLLIAGAAFWTVAILAVLWIRHRLRRQLRIAPTVRSAAPTLWVASPTSAARFHRRLCRVGAMARLAATIDPSMVVPADDLVAAASALEPQVLAVARTGRAGYLVRRDLGVRIAELEAAGRHLTTISTRTTTTGTPSSASRVREHLAALEAAHQELAEIDLRAGVLRHT